MAKYGNSGGRNRGKKYKKLQGFEQATPESEAKARDFMSWYGINLHRLIKKIGANYNDEIATDTALAIYDNIALKQYAIRDYEGYFLRAYATSRLSAQKSKTAEDNIEDLHISANEFNAEKYETAASRINAEILEYVRENYAPYDASIFEIYAGLMPDISYNRLAAMLNIGRYGIWNSLGIIKKDLAKRFGGYRDILLSTDDF